MAVGDFTMSNFNDDRRFESGSVAMTDYSDAQTYQLERQHSRDNFRVGLLPSDGQDAYKKSSARSSRRSRAERTSYLVATGHLDLEETRRLSPTEGDNEHQHSPIWSEHNNDRSQSKSQRVIKNIRVAEHPSTSSSGKVSGSKQTLLHELNARDKKFDVVHQQLQHEFNKSFNKNNLKRNKNNKMPPYDKKLITRSGPTYVVEGDDTDDQHQRGRFPQTYIEVSLPMKTSPAFEYILKDNRRRNKRCCMWLLYSLLVILCLSVIVFSSVHLFVRYKNNIKR